MCSNIRLTAVTFSVNNQIPLFVPFRESLKTELTAKNIFFKFSTDVLENFENFENSKFLENFWKIILKNILGKLKLLRLINYES